MTTFALLGDDDQTIALAAAVVKSDQHQLVWAGDITDRERLRQIAPTLDPAGQWAELLSETVADVVIVGCGDDLERRGEQLKRLVQAGIAIIASHPLCESTLTYFELDMIRRDTSCRMLPYLPGRWHPAVARLAALIGDRDGGDEGPLGQIQQCSIERSLDDRDKGSVFAQFSRDIDLIRALCGEVTRIGAMGTPAPGDLPQADSAYANLNVHLTGKNIQLARWSVGPVQTHSGGQLVLRGGKGQAALDMPDAGVWTIETVIGPQRSEERFDSWEPATEAIGRMADAVSQTEGDHPFVPDWNDASRSIDLAETLEQSLRRGRTIDMHNEALTESRSFKGLMGIAGCGLLLFALFGMVFVAIAQGVARQAGLGRVAEILGKGPILLAAILVLFLLLQLLRLALPKDNG